MKNTFKKEERLCSKKAISSLFHSGSSFVVYPFRVVYSFDKDDVSDVKVILSVSKRIYKRAHDRNRVKRLLREVYRLQKAEILYPKVLDSSLRLHLAIQYIAKEELPFLTLKDKMNKVLLKLNDLCYA